MSLNGEFSRNFELLIQQKKEDLSNYFKNAILRMAAENSHEDWKQIFTVLNLKELEKICLFKEKVDFHLKETQKSPFFYFVRLYETRYNTRLFYKVWPILEKSQYFQGLYSRFEYLEILIFVIKVTDNAEKFQKIFEFVIQKTAGPHDVFQHMLEIQVAVNLQRKNITNYLFKIYPEAIHYLDNSTMDHLDILEKWQNMPEMGPLHQLAINGDIPKFKEVFESQPLRIQNPRSKIIPCTPFHLATWKGHFGLCLFIIENTQDLELEVLEECYILSIRYGHLGLFYLFHKQLRNKNPERLNSTALHKAAKHNRFEMFVHILQSVDCLFKEDEDLGLGYFPLHYAIKNGDMKMCEVIMNKLLSVVHKLSGSDLAITKRMLQEGHEIAVDNLHFHLAEYMIQSLGKLLACQFTLILYSCKFPPDKNYQISETFFG